MNDQGTSTRTRIGLLEVGSRSVRFLVADFDECGSFKAIKTNSYMHGLDLERPEKDKLASLWSRVARDYGELRGFECDRLMVYGTALCRSLMASPLSRPPSYLHVLSPEEEAVASWAAGFMCVRGSDTKRPYTVIDQGGGSTEIITANWTGSTIENVAADSLSIGSKQLVRLFQQAHSSYPEVVQETIERHGEKIEKHRVNPNSEIYLVGSVATKLAWLKVRKDVSDFYKPHLVNDVPLTVREIYESYKTLVKVFVRDPNQARLLIDSRAGSEDEYARVMSSSVFLMLLALKLNRQTVRVSGYGLRHGMGFLVVKGLI